jgi:hypothetical protein
LLDASLPQDNHASLEFEIGQLFSLVAPVENYWAYPGIAAVACPRELPAAREYRLVSGIVDAATRTFSRDTQWVRIRPALGGTPFNIPVGSAPRTSDLAAGAADFGRDAPYISMSNPHGIRTAAVWYQWTTVIGHFA